MHRKRPHRQDGAALLILLAIITLSITTFLLTGANRVQHLLNAPYQNMAVLSQAKSALIASSRLSDSDKSTSGLKHRYFLCPDLTGNGEAEASCNASRVEGWLPWKTLGLKPLRDTSGTCLRYFISSSYMSGALPPPSITLPLLDGDFTLNNQSQVMSTVVVAVIIAPGKVLEGQARSTTGTSMADCGSAGVATNYMDVIAGVNNAVANGFITAPEQVDASVKFNDTLIVILPSDL